MFKRVFFWSVFMLMTSSLAASADNWEVQADWVDPFTGEQVSVARTKNSEGFTVSLFRSDDGRVRAIYALPISSFDRLPIEGRVLMIRPGTERSVEVRATLAPVQPGVWTRSNRVAVRDLIWHGQDPAPKNGTLRNLLDSDTLFARFFSEDGVAIDTSWTLDGSHQALAQALQIETVVSPVEQAWAKTVTETLIATRQRCEANGSYLDCWNSLEACSQILVDSRDMLSFESCMRSRGF